MPRRNLRNDALIANRSRGGFQATDVLWAWLAATLLSGIPSTLYAFATGGHVMEATRAAAGMLGQSDAGFPRMLAGAALVHGTVSLFWALVLAPLLPRRATTLYAIAASVFIAILDLRIIAPAYFPEVAALAFAPQLADHIMWGACFGVTLELRRHYACISADSSRP